MAVGNQQPANTASDFATLQFIVQQMLGRAQTLTLCRVVSCTNEGGIVPVGTLTVQPLVNMMTGNREAIQHKPLYNVPYVRISGGRNAIIIDPQPGDLGLVAFCSRDISAVKASKNISNPGSLRQFDYADGVWIAPCLGTEAPLQYIVMNDDGVRIVSPTAIELQAPVVRILGEFEQSNGDASFAQSVDVAADVTVQGEVTAGNIPLTQHRHNGVTPGGGNSGTPIP
jgi:hypothetical protein